MRREHRELVVVAGVRYSVSLVTEQPNQGGDLLIPISSYSTSSGSCTQVPYGRGIDGIFDEVALEKELHTMMRNGSLAIPFNYRSQLK